MSPCQHSSTNGKFGDHPAGYIYIFFGLKSSRILTARLKVQQLTKRFLLSVIEQTTKGRCSRQVSTCYFCSLQIESNGLKFTLSGKISRVNGHLALLLWLLMSTRRIKKPTKTFSSLDSGSLKSESEKTVKSKYQNDNGGKKVEDQHTYFGPFKN